MESEITFMNSKVKNLLLLKKLLIQTLKQQNAD